MARIARRAALLLVLAAGAGWAGKTPVVPVPEARWGWLQPAVVLDDETWWVGQSDPAHGDTLQFFDVEVANGYLFVATGQGFEIFDLRTSPGNPGPPRSYIYGWFEADGDFPSWNYSDKDWYIKTLSVPPGVDSLAVLGMEDQGIAVVNTAVKNAPFVAYQRVLNTSDVYAFTAGGQHWAYGLSGGKVYRFNLSAAAVLNRCVEQAAGPAVCPGVYGGRVSAFGNFAVALAGVGSYLATGHADSGSLRLWNVADPSAPVPVGEVSGASPVVAMWKAGSSYYVARLGGTYTKTLSIFDVSCVTGGSCGTLATPIWSVELTAANPLKHLSVSTDGGKWYLYVGGEDLGTCEPQREYFFEVTNPASPTELTPQSHPGGYWGWYYMGCSTGFNLVGPRNGEVYSGYLYRAANSILDVHRLVAPALPAVESVSVTPDPVEPCQLATFAASGISGNPWPTLSWRVENASAQVVATGSNVNPFTWTVPSAQAAGSYRVVLTAANSLGSVEEDAPFAIEPLAPLAFTGAGQSPTADPPDAAEVQFHLQTQGASEWAWDFDDDGDPGTQVFGPYSTDPSSGPDPLHTYTAVGTKAVRAKIRNCQNTTGLTSNPVVVVVERLQRLEITQFQPTNLFLSGGYYFGAAGQAVGFVESYTGTPERFDYSWDGDAVYEDAGHPQAVTAHTYLVNGSFRPRWRIRAGAESDEGQLTFPIFIGDAASSTSPAAPSSLSATAPTATSAILSWLDNSANENLFHVELAVSGSWLEVTPPYGADTVQVTLEGLDPGLEYAFRVRASNDAGFSDFSNEASVGGFWNGFEDGSVPAGSGALEPVWSAIFPVR